VSQRSQVGGARYLEVGRAFGTPKGKLINVVFGVFSVPGEQDWSWITQNAFKR